jgi:hypothetical protein
MALVEDDSSLQEQLEAESEELTKAFAREETSARKSFTSVSLCPSSVQMELPTLASSMTSAHLVLLMAFKRPSLARSQALVTSTTAALPLMAALVESTPQRPTML